MSAATSSAWCRRRVSVTGAGQAEFRYYGTRGSLLHDLHQGTLVFHPNDSEPESYGTLSPDEVYVAEAPARGFVDAIRGVSENLAPGDIGALTVALLEGAYLSARNACPIRVDHLLRAKST